MLGVIIGQILRYEFSEKLLIQELTLYWLIKVKRARNKGDET
jgi:hypothetical protein